MNTRLREREVTSRTLAGVARGPYRIEDVCRVHKYIAERLAEHGAHVDQFLFSRYQHDGVVATFARTSDDRMPGAGMANAAAAALNLDLASSWVAGDRPEDIGLAEAIGEAAFYLGRDRQARPRAYSFPSLRAASSFILERIAA